MTTATMCIVAWSALTSAPVAHAQWTAVVLHPAGSADSAGHGVDGTRAVGASGSPQRAVVWKENAASMVNLQSPDATRSVAYAVDGAVIVGESFVGGVTRASIWVGNGGGRIDLHPSGATTSRAYSAWDGWQAGLAIIGGVQSASLWNGSAASWINLHPAGASSSFARGVRRGQQAGNAIFAGVSHAGVWSGNASTWTSIHPAGASSSVAEATNGTQQGGYVTIGSLRRATVWSGTAESRVDLHPTNATESWINDISGHVRVGVVSVNGVDERAAVWYGTSSTWEDLSAVVPGNWGGLYPNSVWTDGQTIRVVGDGLNYDTVRFETVLWTRQLPPPCEADFNGDTNVDFFDYLDFVAAFSIGC